MHRLYFIINGGKEEKEEHMGVLLRRGDEKGGERALGGDSERSKLEEALRDFG